MTSRITKDDESDGELIGEITRLRTDVRRLQKALGRNVIGQSEPLQRHRINVFIEKDASPRKPYLIRLEGEISANLRLSPIRAAIFLVLLLDLKDRGENGRGVLDRNDAVQKAFALLDNHDESDESYQDAIRVAIYRFEFFLEEEKRFFSEGHQFTFDSKTLRMHLQERFTGEQTEDLAIDISTNDSAVAAVLKKILITSPLAKARKTGSAFVPAGPDGADRFLAGAIRP